MHSGLTKVFLLCFVLKASTCLNRRQQNSEHLSRCCIGMSHLDAVLQNVVTVIWHVMNVPFSILHTIQTTQCNIKFKV